MSINTASPSAASTFAVTPSTASAASVSSHGASSASSHTHGHDSRDNDEHTPEPPDEAQAFPAGGRLSVLRKRVRRSGGFLLDHTLPLRRDVQDGGGRRRDKRGSDGRRTEVRDGGPIEDRDDRMTEERVQDSNRNEAPANLFVSNKGKAPSGRLSIESSMRSSPLSREMHFSPEEPTFHGIDDRQEQAFDGFDGRDETAGAGGYRAINRREEIGGRGRRGRAEEEGAINGASSRVHGTQGMHGINSSQNTHMHGIQDLHSAQNVPGMHTQGIHGIHGIHSIQHSQGIDGARPTTRHSAPATQPQPTLDPSQLVQMALNLSEGRRRHVSTGLTLPAASSDTRRIRSAGGPAHAHAHAPALQVMPGSPMGNDFLRPSPARSRHTSRSPSGRVLPAHAYEHQHQHDLDYSANDNEAILEEENIEFQFSAATVNRAERAKKFFELASEYRRLLTHLPPLKPDATAPGNYTFHTMPSPAGYPQINRVRSNTNSKHELGREYNPLQLLRNRRIRHREQRPLDPPIEAFDHVAKVKAYIDDVEQESNHPAYRGAIDTVSLPSFRRSSVSDDHQPVPTDRTHKRNDTSTSKHFRPIGDWSFVPAELFADALWLEQADNKTLIEKSNGDKIFPRVVPNHKVLPSTAHIRDRDRDRASLDSTRSAKKSKESDRPSLERTNTYDSTARTGDESIVGNTSKRGRKKRKMLSLRHVDSAARKHIFRQRDRSNSSSDDSSRRNPFQHSSNLSEDNVAPLDRHMRQLIEREREGASPEVDSPDKWDRSEHQRTSSLPMPDNLSPIPDDISYSGGEEERTQSISGTHTRNTSAKTEGAISPDDRGRFSYDESTAPNSPDVHGFIPSFSMSLSPPLSRTSSPERRFAILKSHSKERQRISETDFATESHTSLPQPKKTNGDESTPLRNSLESIRPSLLKRNKTTNSVAAEKLSRTDSPKDAGVSRFFRGGRVGDLIRSEGSTFGDVLWGKKAPKDAANHATDVSDDSDTTEDDNDGPLKKRPDMIMRLSTTSKTKGKFNTPGLPTFKSHNSHDQSVNDDLGQGPVAKQQELQRENSSRSARFDRLAPPRIQLPDDDNGDDDGRRKSSNVSTIVEERRNSNGHLYPLRKKRSTSSTESSVYELGLPGSIATHKKKNYVTALASATPTASRRPSLQAKRQWSISDTRLLKQQEPAMQQITCHDIARVRALFLSSGIKAYELLNRAHAIVDPPSSFLTAAAQISGTADVGPVRAREEYLLAAKLISKTVTAKTDAVYRDLERCRSERVPGLHAEFEDLKQRVEEQMMPRIQSTADEADAFVMEVTTHQTLAVKQVNDAVDSILRSRRRRLRLLRIMGFAVLEWIVLGVLWVVWFVVVIVRFFRACFLVIGKGVRWCLWL